MESRRKFSSFRPSDYGVYTYYLVMQDYIPESIARVNAEITSLLFATQQLHLPRGIKVHIHRYCIYGSTADFSDTLSWIRVLDP